MSGEGRLSSQGSWGQAAPPPRWVRPGWTGEQIVPWLPLPARPWLNMATTVDASGDFISQLSEKEDVEDIVGIKCIPSFHRIKHLVPEPRECKTLGRGTSLAVQWLRLHLPMHGVRVRPLVRALRSHMPHSQKTKT